MSISAEDKFFVLPAFNWTNFS